MKAQLFSIEFVMTLFIFLGLFLAADNTWNEMFMTGRFPSEMHSEAAVLSQLLISSPGEPVDWNEDDVVTIGLSYHRNIIEEDKLERFINLTSLDYEKAKEVLGTSHDFYLAVLDTGEAVLFETDKKVLDYPLIYSIRRHCILEDEHVIMVLALGEEE